MSALCALRAAGRAAYVRSSPAMPRSFLARRRAVMPLRSSFGTTAARRSGHGEEETFEEFNARFEHEFELVNDVFELQRNLNNAFAFDLVPSPAVIVAAIRAARRLNDFPTAVRVFEAIKAKVENNRQYESYLEELKPLRDELGIILAEDLYPDHVPRGR